MEDLNKHQLILLTLLVSFVTSIATGIITFTLLQEAPVAVTQTINRVVERTIEKVVPEEGTGGTIREVTTVVSEEDLVLESIDKNVKSIVRIKTLGLDGTEIVVGLGIVVSDNGSIVMDKKNYSTNSKYSIQYHDGKTYSISKIRDDPVNGLVYLRPGKPADEQYAFIPATLGKSVNFKLGQTIIAVGGKDRNSVSIGRVSEVETTESDEALKIHSDIRTTRSLSGSPLLNLSGEIVGLEVAFAETDATISYLPVNILQKSLENALVELAK